MKKCFYMLFIISVILSCSHNDNRNGSENQSKKEVMDAAIKYASDKYNEPKATVGSDGTVTIVENQKNFVTTAASQIRYVIEPARITLGLIDDDANEDAIINITSITGDNMETPENLIFIKTDGKFLLNRVIESNMKVLGIKDRIITAEVLTRSINSPLRDCHVCKEVVKYKFKAGDLIRVE